ncbi:MAG: T9SS type A sorting domain-containing protein [Ignavibacteria bacterium]|nr:T9SS type A sorting domain-containing protein [Ignavibacteria bacterium]
MKLKKVLLNLLVIALLAVTYFVSTNVFSENSVDVQEKYSHVRIFARTADDFARMENAGLFLDHSTGKVGEFRDAWLSASEINMLQRSGVSYEILIPDWMEYFNSQPKMTDAQKQVSLVESERDFAVSHSIYGSFAGFLNYNEVVNKLDSMRIQYPNLISAKFSIGTTYEGRNQWVVRMSNNPNVVQGKPEVFYHSLIHAREPESMQHLIYYMYWLLENYNIDPIATYILNTRELYFLPVYNVDGYVYNQTTNPNGGGMWRANRHVSTGNCGPVDPNRNYGIYQYWNSSNNGSSTDSCNGGSGTYRGKYPFSEKETQNVLAFFNSRNFKAVFGAHTYGNYLIKPWAWQDPTPTPDDAKFNEYLADMKATNNYTTGFASQTVGYTVRGGADDWYYNDSINPSNKVIAITPETGLTGFWPTQAEIIPLAQGMLESDKYMSLIAGPYVLGNSVTLNKSTPYTQGESGTVKVKFRNKGLATASNIKVEASSTSSYINIFSPVYSRATLPSFVSDSVTYNFTLPVGAPNNYSIPFTVKIKQNDTTLYSKVVYINMGVGTVTFADSAEQTFSKWTTSNTWAQTTTQSYSPTRSFTDSPTGNYGNNANNSMTMAAPLNISSFPVVFLNFWHRYATESGYDFCKVEVSSDNGSSWQTAASYSGSLTTWTNVSLDITSLAAGSANVKIRFLLTSDGGTVGDGWYVDNIKITNYSTVTGINQISEIADKYSLKQNYPNPFNPSTSIRYAIAKSGFVSLKVFDMTGKVVANLVNDEQTTGSYEVNFNAASLASGVYYYKLESEGFAETKKMLLIK